MKVRKYRKKITELEEEILENGEMNTRQIHDWLNARIRNGVTMNWVGNVMSKCGIFRQVGCERVYGLSGNYQVAVWDSRRRSAE